MERLGWWFSLAVLIAGLLPARAFCDTSRVVIEPRDPVEGEVFTPTPAPTEKPVSAFGFGVKGGVFWSMQNEPVEAFEPVTYCTSPVGGVFADARLGEPLSVQLEMNYLQKGSSGFGGSGSVPKGGGGYTATGTYSYVEFPLLLRLEGELGHNITGYVLLGPSILFLLSQSDTYTYRDGSTLTANHAASVPGTDYDYCLGVGLEVKDIILEFRVGGDFNSSAETFSDGVISYSNFSSFQLGLRLL